MRSSTTATAPPAASGEPDTRPLTKHYPTALRRGNKAFRECAPPEPVVSPVLRRPSHRESIAMLLRVADTWVPDPAEPTGWRKIPAFRAHGAIRSLMVLDALWWYALDQETGTPRTGTSTLAWLMAPLCGWKHLPADKMIDAYASTLRLHKQRLQDAGLVLAEVAQDDWLQDRATDWLLRPCAEDLTDDELAAADATIERYRAKHPDADAARARSAARLAQCWRTFQDRFRGSAKTKQRREKNESTPLPSGLAFGQAEDVSRGLSCDRARAHVEQASPVEFTRLDASSLPTPIPRRERSAETVTEGGETGSRRQRGGRTARQFRDDLTAGRQIAALVALALPEPLREDSALSRPAAAKLGAIGRLALLRLGWDPQQTAEGLARLMQAEDVRLSVAAGTFRRDLRRQFGAGVDEREKTRRAVERHQDHAAPTYPAFLRLNEYGEPVVWGTDAGRPGPRWLACHRVPDLAELNDPEIRRQILAAAYRARITGPQQLLAAMESGRLDHMRRHHADPAEYEASLRGNGCTLLIGLDNVRAAVPQPWSTAAAVRWEHGEPEPTDEQLEIFARLVKRRRAAGLTSPSAPSTAREMFDAIAAMIPTSPSEPTPPAPTGQADRGREILDAYNGDRAAALFATHPDHGGNSDDFQAVLGTLRRS